MSDPLILQSLFTSRAVSKCNKLAILGDRVIGFNTRQMGKSSLRVQVMKRLRENDNYACVAIDLTDIGSLDVTNQTWYAGIIDGLIDGFGLGDKVDLGDFLEQYEKLSPVKWLGKFIDEILLTEVRQNIVIFIDEIDSTLSLDFKVDDFFALIRSFYNRRADNIEYTRLAFVLLGVATPADLIQDKTRTPFNIGQGIELSGFTLQEALPLASGLTAKTNQPQKLLEEILSWTGGQPFLTQKICNLVLASSDSSEYQTVQQSLINGNGSREETRDNNGKKISSINLPNHFTGERFSYFSKKSPKSTLSSSLDFKVDDFFALIRSFYNRRADNVEYTRLAFVLLGVATPADLIQDKTRTPFNIGQGIELSGFTLQEALPLASGLTAKTNQPQKLLESILHWTGGQPFLTQKICKLVLVSSDSIEYKTTQQSLINSTGSGEEIRDNNGKNISEQEWLEKLIRNNIIENWQTQDKPEHLRTIERRVLINEQLASELLDIYQKIYQQEKLVSQNTIEEGKLQLSGLVVKRNNQLQIYNPIYREVFNQQWIENQLAGLRPYSEAFRAWYTSGCQDSSWLLRGNALKTAEQWAADKNLSFRDKQFLAASGKAQIEREITEREKKAELERERKEKAAAEKARKIEEQAREQAEIQLQKANQRVRLGTIVLCITLLIASGLGIAAFFARKIASEAKQETELAKQEAETAETKAKLAKKELDSRTQELKTKSVELNTVNKDLERAQKDVENERNNLIKQQKEIESIKREAENYKQQSEAALQKINSLTQQQTEIQDKLANSQSQLESTQSKLEKQTKEIAAIEKELNTVTELSQTLANKLYDLGKTEEAEEALKYAGLYFQI